MTARGPFSSHCLLPAWSSLPGSPFLAVPPSPLVSPFEACIWDLVFISVDVTFFQHSSIFSSPPPSSPKVLSLPLIFPLSALSSKSPATSPRPLQVYTRRPHTYTGPLNDTSPMAPPSMTSVLPSIANPLISI